MWLCLKNPSAPPTKRLAKSPHIAEMISLYSQVRALGALPDAGGLLDQRADYYAYFAVFAAVEALTRRPQE
jgi:hypothetical protein